METLNRAVVIIMIKRNFGSFLRFKKNVSFKKLVLDILTVKKEKMNLMWKTNSEKVPRPTN